MKKNVSFVFDKPLHGRVLAQEFFDVLLMAAAFDQKVSLYFMADGVFSLLKNQVPEMLDMKNNSPLLEALAIYDVDNLYIEKESMDDRGIQNEQLILALEVLSQSAMNNKMAISDHVFSF
ncbi:MAG: hypothetical protein A6F71_08120 [Cycloclasticus sp. symbiont of Poecilosclerida sp. M]|nr:MAG: hypothetical protein A6F71_08120 [Cycloclasticus sp. symbiont of Poecilosclerida sp. M]